LTSVFIESFGICIVFLGLYVYIGGIVVDMRICIVVHVFLYPIDRVPGSVCGRMPMTVCSRLVMNSCSSVVYCCTYTLSVM